MFIEAIEIFSIFILFFCLGVVAFLTELSTDGTLLSKQLGPVTWNWISSSAGLPWQNLISH